MNEGSDTNPYRSPQETAESPRGWHWLAVGPPVIAVASSALLLFLASHVRADRTHRIPDVQWVGPAADWILPLAIVAWLMSGAAFFLAASAFGKKEGPSLLQALAALLAGLNLFGSCIFWAAVYED